jgi:ankyrin repeat protein
VVLKLIDLFPDAVTLEDKDCWYPLHSACHFNQSETVVLKLIKLCLDAVQQKIKINATHCNMHVNTIDPKKLLFPDVVRVKDDDDWNLLHHAC